jgi:hypothetical protein
MSPSRWRSLTLVVAGTLLPQLAIAEGQTTLRARDTAHVGPQGSYSVGVFSPLTVALSDSLELTTHPLLFLVSPNALLRIPHYRGRDWHLTGEYGVSVPTLAMRALQGFLFPSWETSDKQVGWLVVPRAGVVASHGDVTDPVLTVNLDVAKGFAVGGNDAVTPLGAPAPLELLFAPVLNAYRARLGATYDLPLLQRLRLRVGGDLFLHGKDPSPFTVRAGAALDLAVGRMSRLTLGAMWWNSHQHAVDLATGLQHRSNDVWPSLDFIWAG